MGKLAMWGAVAGGAQGYQKELANREKRDAAKIDEQREARFAKMKMGHDEAMASRSEAHDKNMAGLKNDYTIQEIGARGEAQKEVDASRIGEQGEVSSTLQDDAQAHKTEENVLDRESRERIAALSRTGPSAAAIEAAKRFAPKMMKTTRMNPDTNMEEETDAPGLYDKESGLHYAQKGTDFYLPGDTPSEEDIAMRKMNENKYAALASEGREDEYDGPPVATQEKVALLYENPDKIADFYDKYKFIPSGIIASLAAANAPPPAAPPPAAAAPQGGQLAQAAGGQLPPGMQEQPQPQQGLPQPPLQ